MKILIVDDSRVMRQIVGRTLRQAGFTGHEVVEAVDGADALAKVKEENPELVISDWNMPNKSGLEFLQALRAQGNNVKFGFCTSENTPEMENAAKDAGADFFIVKPFSPDRFEEVFDPILG